MCSLLGSHNPHDVRVGLLHLLLQLRAKCAISLAEVAEAVEVALVLVQLGSQQQVALVGDFVDVLRKGKVNAFLRDDLLSQVVVVVVALFNAGVQLLVELGGSFSELLDIKLLELDLLVLKL